MRNFMDDASKQTSQKSIWGNGDAYESYVGRWSRLVAREFLDWLAVPPQSRWLDVGCGTGAFSQAILQSAAPGIVRGIDKSDGYIAFARRQIRDGRVHFDVGDAQALPVGTAEFDVAVSGLALNFIPQPKQALIEMARAVRPGGKVACYVWDYAGKMQFMRHFWNAAVALDQVAYDLDEGRRSPLCNPEPLTALFRSVNLNDIEVIPIEIATDFSSFDDYWLPFLAGEGPAPGYTMSLSEESRVALRERIRASLPFALDGSIPLVARAWAVKGTVYST